MSTEQKLKHLDRAIASLQAARASLAAGHADQADVPIGHAYAVLNFITTKEAVDAASRDETTVKTAS